MATEQVRNVRVQIRLLGDMIHEKQTYLTRTYGDVRADAGGQDILDTVDALMGLQTRQLSEVLKVVSSELSA